MNTDSVKRWVLMGSTVVGAVGGGIAAPRVSAALGMSFGPWGVAAGALIGAFAGATVVSLIVGDVDFPVPEKARRQG